ncbi:VCBS domain-containing protein, partial [Comamonas antarctica]|uniref:VCBS domain-containing protein n=1 Tax=Comamonas antarctica TaxID=2743470 RepID=UPI0028EF31A3
YGTFTIDANGNWTYALDNANATVQALGQGKTLTEVREVFTADGTKTSVTITITGNNDEPTISGTSTGAVTEDGTTTIDGQLAVSDVDSTDSHTWSVNNNGAGQYGSFSVDNTGKWTYTLDNSSAAVQALIAGQSVSDTITVTVNDGNGGTDTQLITVTINGANDAPVITGAATGAVTEDLALTATGKLTVVDADAGQSSFVAQTGEAMTYGTFTIDANGNWTYALDNANATVQALGQGKTLTEVREVFTADGTKTSVTITITGNNDEPTISGTSTGAVTEDGTTTIDGQLAVSDVDSTDSHTWSVNNNGAGQYGSFTVDNTGKWTYTLDNSSAAVQALIAGQSVSDTITVTVNDGNGGTDTQQITVTINGANDAPVITGAATGAVTEDLALTASGKLTVVDADAGQSSFVAQTGEAMTYGTFTIDANGNWTYALDNTNATVQALGQGKTLTEVREVFTADGTKTSVTITITGNNDEPTISGTSTGAVTEDGTTTIDGQLAVSDVDSTDSHTWSVNNNGAGQYGSFTVDNTGKWTYTLDNSSAAVQALIAGQSVSDTITVTVNDGNGGTDTQQITVTINGANDVPVITGAATGAVTEDLSLTTTGKLTVVDADAGQSSFVAQTGEAMTYGTFTIDANGNWTYALDNANATVQALGQGKTLTEVREVFTADGTKTSVTITITGNNDEPTISGVSTGAVTEDGTTTIDGQLAVSDVDSTDTHTWSVNNNGAGQYGSFTVDNTGKWTYTLDNSSAAVQALTAGQSVSDTITVTVDDGNGGTDTQLITVTINGANDAPVITGAATGAVTEDLALTATGKLTVVDADAGQSSFVAQTGEAMTYGTFTIDANGNWTYALDNTNATVQALGQGKTLTEVREVFTADGTKTSVTITITGNNDEPTISGTSTGAVTEDGTTTIDGQLAVSDVDSTDSHTWSVNNNGAGQYGSFTVDNTGKWTYTLDNSSAAVQALTAGQSVSDTITVTVDDGNGGTDTQQITVTINGANDAPVITGAATGTVTEDLSLTTTGKLTVVDADAGQSSFVAQTGVATTYGTFTIDANGNWTYALNNTNADVQALGKGETMSEVVQVTTADGSKTSVTITIQGNNDAPTISGVSTGTVTEDGVTRIDGQLTVSDVDTNDTHTWSVNNNGAGQYGSFTVDGTGKWTYALDNDSAAVQALVANQQVSDTITVTVNDGNGGTKTQQITVTINGANDGAVVTGNNTATLKEDVTTDASGKLNVTDADANQSYFVEQRDVAVQYGKFTITNDGNWNYRLNNNDPVIQQLREGQTLTETVTVRTADGTLAQVNVTITGTNDLPQLSQADRTITENPNAAGGVLTAIGALTITDADAGEARFQTGAVLTRVDGPVANANTALGTLTFNADGSYSYSVDNSKVAYLKSGESVVETYTVTSFDQTRTSTIVIRIQGQDSGAVVTPATPGSDKGSVTEDGTLTTGGKLDVVDPDAGQAVFVAQNVTTTYGQFTIGSNGTWTYTLNNANPAVQALGAGQTLTETREVSTADGTKANVVITINGTNDVPTLGTGVSAVTEDVNVVGGKLLASGSVSISDVDAGQSSFKAGAVYGGSGTALGTLVFNTNGTYSYSVDNSKVQYLKTGESVVETYTVTSSDGSATTTIKITINGADDGAIISPATPGSDKGSVTEDGTLTTGGKLDVVDPDAGQAVFVAQNVTTTYGQFTIGSNGTWTYTLNNANPAVQALGAGQTLTETREVSTADGTKANVVITINGTNDVPTLGTGVSAVTEDVNVVGGKLLASGSVSISDVDAGQSSFKAGAVYGGSGTALGTLVFNTNGTYSYSVDNSKVQYLKTGESVVETYTVTSSDGSATTTIKITINGADDGAIISPATPGSDKGSVTEDGTLTTGGKLDVVDPDAGQAVFVAQNVTTTYGQFTIGSNGTWTYTLNNANPAVQALGAGQTLTETREVSTADGTKANVVITINGTNDVPTLGTGVSAVTEDVNVVGGKLLASGSVSISDVDAGQSSFKAGAVYGGSGTALGTLVFNTNGTYSYSVDNSKVQYLKTGESVVETYTVTSSDGSATTTIKITINGADDGAIISPATPGSDKGSVTEDGTLTTGGKLDVVDPDAGQAVFVAQNVTTTYGQFTIGSNGTWTYTLNNANPAVQALGAGQTLTETREVSTADGTKANVVITINGTNDVPTLGTGVAAVTEDVGVVGGRLVTSGSVSIADTDTGESSFKAGAVYNGTGTALGTLVFNTDGTYSYSVDNSKVQYLQAGEKLVETYTVTSKDGTASTTIAITITGANDIPTLSGTVTGAVKEDVTTTVSGQLSVTDVDLKDTHTWSVNNSGKGQYGSFTVDATGKWTYVLDNASAKVQALTEGQKVSDTITVTVNDGKGGTAEKTITVEITGTNEAPVAQAVTGTAPEDNTVAIALRGSDADGTVVSFQLTSLAANGTLYKDAAGTQVLTTKDVITATSNGATIYFKPTQDWSGTTSFNYSAKDNLGQVSTSTATGTITVTPVADTPTVSLSVGAGSNPVTTVINTATVSTTNTGHTVTANNADGSKGTVSIVTGTDHDGFGVSGNVSSNTGAASTELAGNGTVSESLTVAFKVPVTKITVQFAWLASGEQARYKMYDEAGNLIKTAVVQGKTDTVEEQFSLTAPVGTTIGKIVFDAPRNGDDYLVHKVTYTTATTYPLTITADPRDIDFSETISKVVVEVPFGVTLSAGTQIDATHWSVPLTSSGSYSVSVDATTKAVTITGLNMTVPENVTVGDIKVVATASDGASTADATYVYHGVPVANDDTATAVLTSRAVTTAAKQDTLAAFSNNETTAWRFTSATTVDKDRVELSSTAVLKTDLGKWLSTSLQGTTLDAQTSGNALILRDNNDSSSGDAQLVTPVYSPTVDGTTLQFRVTGFSNFSSYFDIANWQLYKSADGGTTWSSQPVQRGDITSSGTIITGALEANASYRIVFTVEDNIGWGTGSAAIGLDDFQANVPATSSIEWSTTAINGSVTANDTLGTLGETSTVSVKVGSTWVDASAGGTTVTGSYGTLVLKSDGSYTYTPTASAAGAGKVDHFEYKLTQADGDTANANLDITLSATGPGAPVATLSARMVDTTSTHEVHGTSGSDTLLGTAEDDLFVWHQGDAGTAAKPVTDVVKNFGASGNDSLDLSDLLQGEESSTDLSKFLHLETKTEADGKTIDTVIKVSSAGALDADGNGFNQQILLEGVNLTTAGHDQNSMIKDLIDQGKLKIDHS